jgi:hypothetical protein
MTEPKTTQKQFDQIFSNVEEMSSISTETKNKAIEMLKGMIDDVEKATHLLDEKLK